MNVTWKLIPVRPGFNSVRNLYVGSLPEGTEIGIVEKPEDTKGCVNLWRAFLGVGEGQEFLGHSDSKREAQGLVESAFRSRLIPGLVQGGAR